MIEFATQELDDDYAKALNENSEYKQAVGPAAFPPDGWGGDFIFFIEPSGPLLEEVRMWISLYHGNCTGARILSKDEKPQVIHKVRRTSSRRCNWN